MDNARVYTIANNAVEVSSGIADTLFVYDTCVCRIVGGDFVRVIRNNPYQNSHTTMKNINRFRARHGMGKITVKEWRML